MSDSLSFSLLYRRVLIDTWWNVNIGILRKSYQIRASFNRYMVECECIIRNNSNYQSFSFNRYMVECEFV